MCRYLGRGVGHPLALERALKPKELSYNHAEGYPARSGSTGRRADADIVIAPRDAAFVKSVSNILEIAQYLLEKRYIIC